MLCTWLRRWFFPLAIFALFFCTASTVHAETSPITESSIFELTNDARTENGDEPLVWDEDLSAVAEDKLDDMFEREYFAHKDPDGNSAGARAKKEGYDYFLLGENLAMGWFESPDELVDAWMASAGHRKNILRDEFTAIGIAFDTREFEGEETMIAVQIFARPMRTCRPPSSELAAAIAMRKNYVRQINDLMNAYLQGAGASNTSIRVLTSQVSVLMTVFLRELDDKVRAYNAQVKSYEDCARGT